MISSQQPTQDKDDHMSSRLGFFLFAGFILGTFVGGYTIGSPAIGSVVCAAIGAGLALYLDRRANKEN